MRGHCKRDLLFAIRQGGDRHTYLHHAENLRFKSAVVRTPDSDIFFILRLHAHDQTITIYLDTGTGKHRKLINIGELADKLGEDWCATLLGFYVFSGEDCTSAFS